MDKQVTVQRYIKAKLFFVNSSFYSSPIYAMVLEKEDAVQSWRLLIGPTDSNKAKETEQNR